MPDIPPASTSASVAVADEPEPVKKRRPPPSTKPGPSRKKERRLRTWWWVGFIPLAVLAGGVSGLLWRTQHTAAMAAKAAPVVAPLVAAAEGWRWLFTEQEWRDRSHGIGLFTDGLLQFRGTIGRPQPAADGAIRARVVMRGPLPQPVSVYLRGTEASQIRWVLDPAQRNARLIYTANGQDRKLGEYRLAKPLEEGDRVQLELRAAGAEITGLINGAEVVRAHDPRGTGEGQWGIVGDGAWFEVVEVTEPMTEKAVAATAPPVPVPIAPPEEKPHAPVAAATPAEPVAAPAPDMPTPAPLVATTTSPTAPALATPAPAAPAAATPAAGVDTAQWLATMDAQWHASYQRDVAGPFEKGATELRRLHVAALESPLAAATRANKNDEEVAWRIERDQVSRGSNPPATDEESTPPALKLLRANFRAQFARIDRERFERARALFAKCDDLLVKSQVALLQRQRADEAATVQKERDQLRAEWLQPPAAVVATALPHVPAPVAAPTKLTAQQIAEKLMALGADVWVKRGKAAPVQLKSATEVGADEKLAFTRVDFHGQKPDQKAIETADYDVLDSLSEVTDLTLAGLAVKDTVMEKLRAFRALKSLSLNGAKPPPASYSVLPALPELQNLYLDNSETSDEAMKSVVQCRKLQRLHLVNLPITDAGLADLGKLTALEELQMVDLTKLESPGFAHLVDCRALKNVHASNFIILSGMVEHLGHCKALETVSLPGSKLKDAQVAPLATLPKIRSLDLSGSAVTSAAFAMWPQRAEMVSLNLTNAGGVDDAGCKTIEHTFPKLQDLDINLAATGFSSEGAAALSRLRGLRTLRLTGPGVDDDAVAELAHRDTITTLSIPAAQLSEAGVVSLAHFPHLANLSIDVPPITEAAMKSFTKCKDLKSINIGKAAPPDTEAKFKSLPGVVVVRAQG